MTEKSDIKDLHSETILHLEKIEFIGLTTGVSPAMASHLLSCLKSLEAERQRADTEQELNKHLDLANRASEGVNANLRRQVEKAEAEIAALRGEQEPVAYLTRYMGCRSPDDCEEYLEVSDKDGVSGDGETAIPVFAQPPKPVVVDLPDTIEPCDVIDILDPTANPEDYACCVGADMYNAAIKACRKSLESAGIVVKDGE